MKKKDFVLIITFLFSLNLLSALPSLEDLTSQIDEINFLRIVEKGDCSRSTEDGPGLIWLPEHELSQRVIQLHQEMDPGLAVEIVSFIPLENTTQDDFILKVMNQYLSVSDQEGITYYSSSRKKEMVLIQKSFTVEQVGSKKPIEDPSFTEIPSNFEAIIYQKDSSFGGNHFLYEGEIYEDAAIVKTTNMTTMSVMKFFTVAKPEENLMTYIFIPCQEGLYIYTAVFVDNPPTQEKIFGISVNIEGFFLKRVRRILEWFSNGFTPQ